MRENEIKQIKGKKVEAWIGLVLLILPLIAVVALFLMWFGIVDLLDWDWLSRFVNLKMSFIILAHGMLIIVP